MRNLSISTRLILASGLAVALLAASAFVAYRQSTSMAESLRNTAQDFACLQAVSKLQKATEKLDQMITRAASNNGEEAATRFEVYHETALSLADQVGDLVRQPQHRETIGRVAETLRSTLSSALGMLRSDDTTNIMVESIMLSENFHEAPLAVQKLRAEVQGTVGELLEHAKAGNDKPVVVMMAFIIAAILFSALSVGWVVRSSLLRPVQELNARVERVINHGDLTQTENIVTGNDVVGRLAADFVLMLDKLRIIPQQLETLSGGLSDAIGELTSAGENVRSTALQVERHASGSSELMAANVTSLDELSTATHTMRQGADTGMQSNEAVDRNGLALLQDTSEMASAIETVAQVIEDIDHSASTVAHRTEDLDRLIDDTTTSLVQMDTQIHNVERTAQSTQELAENAAHHAASGSDAMQRTNESMASIQTASDNTAEVIERLTTRLGQISRITSAISDIAGQTGLLSLNASIIASQAGEHGRGFAVVAVEVKALAARTQASNAEIARIVEDLLDESQHALETARAGRAAVDRGKAVSEEASAAFSLILESAGRTHDMVTGIAGSSSEQSSASRHVTDSVQRISAASRDIRASTSSQVALSGKLASLAAELRRSISAVKQSAERQTESSSVVGSTLMDIGRSVRSIDSAQREQAQQAGSVADTLQDMKSLSQDQNRIIDTLQGTIANLSERSAALRTTISRFRY